MAVMESASTCSAGGSGGNVPCVWEYAIDHASGISSRRARSAVPATAIVPETTTYGPAAHGEGRNCSR